MVYVYLIFIAIIVSVDNTCITQTDMIALNELFSEIHDAGLKIDASGNLVNVTRWDIRTAIFFSLQLVATIGNFNAFILN